jgi:hypothetical protein
MKQLITFFFLFVLLLKFGFLSAQTDTLVGWNFPNNPDNNIADKGIAANITKTIINTASGTTVYNATGATTSAASNTNWATGSGVKYWEVEFSTLGYNNVTVQSKQRSSNTGPRDFKVQYKVGLTGIWTDVAGATILDSNDWVHGVLPATALPAETFNQPSVYLQWIMTSDISANSLTVATTGTSRMDDLFVIGNQISNAAEIISLDIPTQVSSTVISATGNVNVVMPFGTNLTALVPAITLSAGATISPISGIAQNFSAPFNYTVTASDGTTTKLWTVTVTVQAGSNAAEIVTFDIPTQLSSTVNSLASTVSVVMPLGTNLTTLIPAITLSTGAAISPLSGVSQDFTSAVLYTVTAEDGSTTKIWTVNVSIQANNQAEIITFNIPSQISSTVNSLASTVSIVMPFGTNVTTLIPTITLSTGATVSPLSGAVQDFTTSVTYIVTAEDATTTKTWTVNVTVQAGSSAAEIITFDITGQTSSTVNSLSGTVDIVMPSGSVVIALVPTITISANAAIAPNTGISQDFTLPVTYIVTAEDGTIKNWTVTVTVAKTTIVEWNFPNNPDDNIADGGITANLTKTILTNATGTVSYTNTGATTFAVNVTGWEAGIDTKFWEIEFTTASYQNITLESKQRGSNTGPRDFKVQYRIGTTGVWTDVPNTNIADTSNWTMGVLPETALPVETENQSSVYLRWIMTSDISANGTIVASTGTGRIDDIIVRGVLITNNNEVKLNNSFSFSLYPNPANEYVNLILNNNLNTDLSFELISIDGKVLLKEKLQNNIISLKGISSGIYFIKVVSSGRVNIQKLIVN